MFVDVIFHIAPVPVPPPTVPVWLGYVGSINVASNVPPLYVTSHIPPLPLPCKYDVVTETNDPVPSNAVPLAVKDNTSPPVSTLPTTKLKSFPGD